jgi:hypothetical protein
MASHDHCRRQRLSLNFFLTRPISPSRSTAATTWSFLPGGLRADLGRPGLGQRREAGEAAASSALIRRPRDLELSGPATSRLRDCSNPPTRRPRRRSLRDESDGADRVGWRSKGSPSSRNSPPTTICGPTLQPFRFARVTPRHCRARNARPSRRRAPFARRPGFWGDGRPAGSRNEADASSLAHAVAALVAATATRSRQRATRSEAARPGSPFPAGAPRSSLQYR